ncbi:hypothetical protein [Terrihabitans sp. B22-R8]|uniref:hypothetical protein n=1 Tax=Terrihabitans sp. B22-R8 TaxID=3425128 RepID=UPI00403C98D6
MRKVHEFSVGTSVMRTVVQLAAETGSYDIICQMPEGSDGELQYRIKSALEKGERMVRECDIRVVSGAVASI